MQHDEAAIRALHAHYSHLLDDLRLEELAQLFCQDGEWMAGDIRFSGREAIIAGFRTIEPDEPGRVKHLTFEPIVRFDAGSAYSWADAIALSIAGPSVEVAAAGRYHDEYAMEGGSWRFRKRVFVYSGAPLPEGLRPSPGYGAR